MYESACSEKLKRVRLRLQYEKKVLVQFVCGRFTAGASTGTGVVNFLIIVQVRFWVILVRMRFAAVFGFSPEKACMWVRYTALWSMPRI